jgi:hypothetical protein
MAWLVMGRQPCGIASHRIASGSWEKARLSGPDRAAVWENLIEGVGGVVEDQEGSKNKHARGGRLIR